MSTKTLTINLQVWIYTLQLLAKWLLAIAENLHPLCSLRIPEPEPETDRWDGVGYLASTSWQNCSTCQQHRQDISGQHYYHLLSPDHHHQYGLQFNAVFCCCRILCLLCCLSLCQGVYRVRKFFLLIFFGYILLQNMSKLWLFLQTLWLQFWSRDSNQRMSQ